MKPAEPWNLKVTRHAVERYRERHLTSHNDMWVANKLREMISDGKEYKLRPEHRVRQLLAHDCKEAVYVKYGKFIIVIEDSAVITLHFGTADKWEPV